MSRNNDGEYSAVLPTYLDKQPVTPQYDSSGRQIVSLSGIAEGSSLPVSLSSALQGLIAGVETDSILSLPGRRADAFQVTITSADATTATAVKAKTAAKSIYITDLIISSAAAINIQLQDDAGTPVVHVEQMYFPANSIFSKSFSTPIKLATNVDLDVIASGAGAISVTVTGYVI